MSYPRDLRVSVDRVNTFKCGQPVQEPEFGYLIQPGGLQHKILCQLTDRVISAYKTQHAHAVLQRIADVWRLQYKPDLDAADAATCFQNLLNEPSEKHCTWAIVVIAWAMPSEIGGTHLRGTSINRDVSEFWLDDQYIALNGVRLDLHRQDVEAGDHERHIRWLELFWSYCHEVAHMFVTYLSKTYQGNVGCKTPDGLRTSSTTIEGGEAGDVFEEWFFGGRFLRSDDGSNRNPIYMTGIPGLRNRTGDSDIPLNRILNITNKTTRYVDGNFILEAYRPNKPSQNQWPNPHQIHSKWLEDFWGHFGRPFAPLQVYSDSVEFPDRLGAIVTTDPAHRYNIEFLSRPRLILQGSCTRMVYYKYGSRVYILTAKVARSLKEQSDRSAASLAAHKGQTAMPAHQYQRKILQAAPRADYLLSRRPGKESHHQSQPRVQTVSPQRTPLERSPLLKLECETATARGKTVCRPRLHQSKNQAPVRKQEQSANRDSSNKGRSPVPNSNSNTLESSSRRSGRQQHDTIQQSHIGQLSHSLRASSLSSARSGYSTNLEAGSPKRSG